jgi:hypothetical protein
MLVINIAARLIKKEKAERQNEQEEEDNAKKIDIHDYDCPPRNAKDFLTLRPDMDNEEEVEQTLKDDDPFLFLVEHLIGQAHGLRNWKNAKCFQTISNTVTVSDEAFVLLSIENCWDAIQDEIQEDGEDEESSGMGKQGVYPRGKYTNHGTNSRYGGWSPQGINRFNELYELVEDNRNTPWAEKVEEEVKKKLLVRHHRTTDPNNKRRKKRRIGNSDEQEEGREVLLVPVKARSSLGSFKLPDGAHRV